MKSSRTLGAPFEPEIGSSYQFELIERKEITQTLGENEQSDSSIFTSKATFSYNVSGKIPPNCYKVSVRFNSVKQENVHEIDSINNLQLSSSRFQNALKAFDGAIFDINVNSLGKVMEIEGYGDFKSRFDSLYEDHSNENSNGLVVFSKKYFNELFEKISAILPDSSLSIGFSWVEHESPIIGDRLKMTATYKVIDIKDSIANIKTSYTIDQELQVRGKTIKVKGNGEGNIDLNIRTGMLIRSDNQIVANSYTDLKGIKVTITIKYRTEIRIAT